MVVLLIVVFSIPQNTSAFSISSIFGKLTQAQTKDNEGTFPNLSNIPLLEAPLSRNPRLSLLGESFTMDKNSLIAEMGPGGGIATVFEERTSDEIIVYTVREGDTLGTVAELFDVSINTVKWSNDIKGTTLKVGSRLVILPVSGIVHIVQKGDTISSVAKKYKGDTTEIKEFNNLTDSKLAIGAKIVIPGGELPAAVVTRAKSISTSSIPTYQGYYMLPASGRRTRGISRTHKGVDIAAPTGTPIYASAEGTVIVARNSGYGGGFGRYVVISHPNGTQTLYAHQSNVADRKGFKCFPAAHFVAKLPMIDGVVHILQRSC